MLPLRRVLALSGALLALTPVASAATIPAANDPRGTFIDGTFRLPALDDPADQYILKVAVAGEKDARTYTVPAGGVGFILGDNAIPQSEWSWTFRVQKTARAPVLLVTPDQLHISAWDLHYYNESWLLEWNKLTGANKYILTVAVDKEEDLTKPPKWGAGSKIECNVRCVNETAGATAFESVSLQAGKRYRWNVAALDTDDIVIGQSEPREIFVASGHGAAFKKAGWKLQRSDTISAQNAAKPALFGYVADEDETHSRTTAYSVQAALLWHGSGIMGDAVFPSASLETRRTSSGDAKASDVSRARVGAFGAFPNATWSAAIKYETARKDHTDKGMLELGITPVFGVLDQWLIVGPAPARDSTGNILPSSVPILQLKPLISFSADIGKTFSVGTSDETNETVRRLRSDLRLDMLWPRLARQIGVVYIDTYAEKTYWRLLGQGKSHRLDQAGLTVGITPEISFDVSYSNGEDAPVFKFARSTNVGLGIKF